MGRIPDYYFQAIGSGSGAIAVLEAAKRLIADGRFGHNLPRLMLSQNLPFIPIYLSWKSKRRDLIECRSDDAKMQIMQIAAQVLSNRWPPYGIRGGVFDALNESRGDMLVADNGEVLHAARMFEDSEGIDIDPAGAVALASLLKTSRCGEIDHNALTLLNVTGAGAKRYALDNNAPPIQPDLRLDQASLFEKESIERISGLFERSA